MAYNCQYSFWEKQCFSNFQFIVVGSGIVGLSTALTLRKKHPKASILVLERGLLPTGASTKNAGFACFGSATEIYDDLKQMPEQEVFNLVKMRWEGLQILRNRLGDKAIDFKSFGGYELISENEAYILPGISQINSLIKPVFNEDVFYINKQKLSQFGFKKVKYLIENPFEGQIDTGKMMRSLIKLALTKNIEIKTGAEVVSYQENGNNVEVKVKNIEFPLKAQKLIICTNAFARKLVPNIDLYPGRGQVLVTKPIDDLPFKGVFHFDRGYYYFRNFGNRVIFGGGRNQFLKQETTIEFDCTENVIENLKQKLTEIILPNKNFEIEHIWSGIMAFGKNKKPIVSQISKNVYAAVRLGGMGVAIGSLLAEKVVSDYDL
jgi:glycine/D-amino acid oxidase-like deaminating enzyme